MLCGLARGERDCRCQEDAEDDCDCEDPASEGVLDAGQNQGKMIATESITAMSIAVTLMRPVLAVEYHFEAYQELQLA